ncbi:MAG: ParB-like nuclease domain-containing protein [Leptospiraceae bacterium]|nr:ParB-like nuclease domain-containing protein [Leptospiraceae bacterium]
MIEYVHPDELEITHGISDRKRFEELLTLIITQGILEPLKVVLHNDLLFIVDGHHRHKIANLLQMQQIPIEYVNLLYNGYFSTDDLIYQDIQ